MAGERACSIHSEGNLPTGGFQRQACDKRIFRRNVERRLTGELDISLLLGPDPGRLVTLLRASLQIVADRLVVTQFWTWYGERLEQHLSAQAVNFINIPFLTRPEIIRFRW